MKEYRTVCLSVCRLRENLHLMSLGNLPFAVVVMFLSPVKIVTKTRQANGDGKMKRKKRKTTFEKELEGRKYVRGGQQIKIIVKFTEIMAAIGLKMAKVKYLTVAIFLTAIIQTNSHI